MIKSFYIGIPRLSGSGGTFGYTIYITGRLKELLKHGPFGKQQFDCYGIKHTVKIFRTGACVSRRTRASECARP